MKPSFLLLLLLVGWPCLAQTVPSSCTPSAQLRNSYRNDVADLALQRLYEIHSPDTALIEIPQRYQDTIWQALAAVANTGAALEADSVFRNYCVHRWPYQPFSSPSFRVQVDTSYAWAKQWFLGNALTGNAAIDSFMARHGVVLASYYYDSSVNPSPFSNHVATLRTSRAINGSVFIDSFRRFPGIYYGYKELIIGDGDNIYYNFDSSHKLVFFAGWGDCMSGCTEGKYWSYTVDLQDCSVTLKGISAQVQYGYRRLTNCNGNPISIAPVSPTNGALLTLAPNPATTSLQLNGLAGGPLTYSISDIAGRTLLKGTTHQHAVEIALLLPGFYLLTVQEASGRLHQQKFVKH